jgi:hypothetical protein
MISLFLAIAMAASHVFVPGLYGDVREGANYASGASLQLSCGTESATATTDKYGSFRLSTKSSGKCQLKATYKGQTTAPIEVVLYSQPVRCLLALELKSGTYVLTRR